MPNGLQIRLLGTKGFFLHGVDDVSVMALFFFMMVFMDTTATIPTGAMAERWRWKNFVPLWVLGGPALLHLCQLGVGRRLAGQAGMNWGLGHGAVDFAGSGVVHAMGGIISLAGCIVHRATHRQIHQRQAAGHCPATTFRWWSSARSSWPSAGSGLIRARRCPAPICGFRRSSSTRCCASFTGALAAMCFLMMHRPASPIRR